MFGRSPILKRLAGRGSSEIEAKASRFLGEAYPVTDAQEAAELIRELKKKHYTARHCCYAYVLGESGMDKKASDDGEPSGTAGRPILSVIEGSGLSDCLVCVVRYFGGTLLGTGGLVRAYTQAAKEAVAAAGIREMVRCTVRKISVDYGTYNSVSYYLKESGIMIRREEFGAEVEMELVVREEEWEELQGALQEMTSGRVTIKDLGKGIFPIESEMKQQ